MTQNWPKTAISLWYGQGQNSTKITKFCLRRFAQLKKRKICLPKNFSGLSNFSLRKQPPFGDAAIGFPAKWRLRNARWNSILMTRHYPDLGSAFGWLNQVSHAARPIRNTNQIWVVTRHQCGISALVPQTSFRWQTGGGVAKCRPFSQATPVVT